ncbi:MAG: DUF1460 domain-containing protein [Bacteroidales bacterium]|nr:DUF1460 domain-containing protein [Bacteroidales bacterium]
MKPKLPTTLLLTLLLLFSAKLTSQETSVVTNSEAIFNRYVEHISPYRSTSLENVLEKTALFFIGTPYVESTLDKADEEQLVINLEEFDCVTYVENVLALSLSAKSNEFNFDSFKKQLQDIRYRNGEVVDYASRLHYTSDWIYENEINNRLKNSSLQLLGRRETKEINFMSTHRSAYKQLAHDDAMLHKIEETEKHMNARGGFYYLPKQDIAAKAAEITHMALVGFVTTIDGLDTTHVGFAYQKDGQLTFIHASSGKVEVIVDSKTLSEYCLGQKNCKGIIVAEINE